MFLDNVTGERVFTSTAHQNVAFGADGTAYAVVGRLRVVGIEAGYRW
ncbi:hypothetical protein GCM10028794_26660 [Silanimonas algicola]